jgi:hypothetical protein
LANIATYKERRKEKVAIARRMRERQEEVQDALKWTRKSKEEVDRELGLLLLMKEQLQESENLLETEVARLSQEIQQENAEIVLIDDGIALNRKGIEISKAVDTETSDHLIEMDIPVVIGEFGVKLQRLREASAQAS